MAAPRRTGSLSNFTKETFEAGGETREIYRGGTGPAVIVIAEIPGITPHVLGFAERVVEIGCTAVLPVLFGTPGLDLAAISPVKAVPQFAKLITSLCVSREFTNWATGKTSPVIAWLRELAKAEHERCGGPGVGAVGMCFTGGFALAMSTIPEVIAPVLAQPSLPFAATKKQQNTIDISEADLEIVSNRCAAADLKVVGLRFAGDRMVPQARFDFLKRRLGDAFIAVVLPDESAHPDGPKAKHCTLTEHLNDEPGNPTHDGLQLVLEHFRSNLLAS